MPDAFDALEDIQEPTDEIEETAEETETGEPETSTPEKPEEPQVSLEDRIAELERANRGLLNAKREESRKRQEIETRFNQLNSTVTDVLSRRKQPEPEEEPKDELIPVQVDENGNAYLPKSALVELAKSGTKDIADKVTKIESNQVAQTNQQQLEAAFNQTLSRVIGQDEQMQKGYTELVNQYGWIDKQFKELTDTGESLPKMTSSGMVLNVAEKFGLDKKFEKQFPGVDLGIVVHSFDGDYDLKRALKHLVPKEAPKEEQPEDKKTDLKTLKKIAEKGESLLGMRNQKDARTTTLDEIASKSFVDLLNMTDAQAAELEAALRAQEEA